MDRVMASRATAEWKAIFDKEGIPAAGVKFPVEMFEDDQALANGMYHDLQHPALGTVRVISTPLAMDGKGFVPAPATPPFGSEARTILTDLGFSDADIDAMLRDGVTRTSLPSR